MGTKVPIPVPPPEFGNDCLKCFTAGHTPKFFVVTFTGITACPGNSPPPNNIPFLCEQDAINPCFYFCEQVISARTWRAYYYPAIFAMGTWHSYCQLACLTPPQVAHFVDRAPLCALDFTDPDGSCPGWGGEGGSAHAQTVVPHIIILLCSEYHFMTQPGKLYEIQNVGMDHQLVRIATKFDKSCCYFYVDNQELEVD